MCIRSATACFVGALACLPCSGRATRGADPEPERPASIGLADFRPQSMLKVPRTNLRHARFPVVDVHTHFGIRLKYQEDQIDGIVRMFDRNRVAVAVSLDGTLGTRFEPHRNALWKQHRDRFVVFVNIDWQGRGDKDDPATWDCHRPGFVRQTVLQLRAAQAAGASGLKIFKRLGLSYKYPDGSLLRVDDPRWDPIWQACGELRMPVLIHTADPAAFFLPTNERNERWEELQRHPDWSFFGDAFPSREVLLESRNRVIARHPKTNFIGAHVANNAEDLQEVGSWLDRYPNLYVEIASRISELGRQPYTARRFFMRHADRILFGTDGPWAEERLRLYWRFLETRDEYFPYADRAFPPQGFWQMYGIGLPDDVLRKLYHENAEKLIPGVRERLDAWEKTKG